MRLLILTAFNEELSGIKGLFKNLHEITFSNRKCLITRYNNFSVLLSSTGIGTISAANTTTVLCEHFQPDLILICGVAGGFNNIEIGNIVIGNRIIDYDLYLIHEKLINTPYESCLQDPHTDNKVPVEFVPNEQLLEIALRIRKNSITAGAIISSNIFPIPCDFIENSKKFNASAIEMENVGVYKAALHYNTPVLAIRAISNLIDNNGNDNGTVSTSIDNCSKNIKDFIQEFLNFENELQFLIKKNNPIKDIINKYDLIKHPEGGWYCQTFCSQDLVRSKDSKRYNDEFRSAGTSIIFLLAKGDYSGWHSVKSDETWYFHSGASLILRVIDPNTNKITNVLLGIDSGCIQYTVKAGHVFSAETLGDFSLCGCAVTPGFVFNDFKLLTKKEFLTNFPEHKTLIRLVTEQEQAVL